VSNDVRNISEILAWLHHERRGGLGI